VANGEVYAFTDWSYRSSYNFFLYEAVEYKAKDLLEGGLRVGYKWGDGKYDLALYGRNITDRSAIGRRDRLQQPDRHPERTAHVWRAVQDEFLTLQHRSACVHLGVTPRHGHKLNWSQAEAVSMSGCDPTVDTNSAVVATAPAAAGY
jgi:hypothetical protein